MANTYIELITTKNGRMKGCLYCKSRSECPDALSVKAGKCNCFDHSILEDSTEKSNFFEETMQGLLEAVAIDKGEIPLVDSVQKREKHVAE